MAFEKTLCPFDAGDFSSLGDLILNKSSILGAEAISSHRDDVVM